jgi:heme exporter protein D
MAHGSLALPALLAHSSHAALPMTAHDVCLDSRLCIVTAPIETSAALLTVCGIMLCLAACVILFVPLLYGRLRWSQGLALLPLLGGICVLLLAQIVWTANDYLNAIPGLFPRYLPNFFERFFSHVSQTTVYYVWLSAAALAGTLILLIASAGMVRRSIAHEEESQRRRGAAHAA